MVRCPSCHQPAGITHCTSSFLKLLRLPNRRRAVTPFTSALRLQHSSTRNRLTQVHLENGRQNGVCVNVYVEFVHLHCDTSTWVVLLVWWCSFFALFCLCLPTIPGMAGIVPELTHGVPCPGRGSFCPGNVKIDHRAWVYGCSLMSVLYFVLCLSVTHDLTWV